MLHFLDLPDIFYLGVYQPFTGECEDFDFTEYSSAILSIKNCESSVINEFVNCIDNNLDQDFDCVVVVPPHHSGSNNSGIKILAQKLAQKKKLIDGTSCLIRHKSIDQLSKGGNRSKETHLQSIKVVNEEIIKGKKILLFDDVSTTGNSLKACQELLKVAGAATVKCFVLGKTTRSEEELDSFYEQHSRIKTYIEEEDQNYSIRIAHESIEIDCKYQKEFYDLDAGYSWEKQELQDDYDQGNLSDENFEQFDTELEEEYYQLSAKLCSQREEEEEGNQVDEAINSDVADRQKVALNNLYFFSGLFPGLYEEKEIYKLMLRLQFLLYLYEAKDINHLVELLKTSKKTQEKLVIFEIIMGFRQEATSGREKEIDKLMSRLQFLLYLCEAKDINHLMELLETSKKTQEKLVIFEIIMGFRQKAIFQAIEKLFIPNPILKQWSWLV